MRIRRELAALFIGFDWKEVLGFVIALIWLALFSILVRQAAPTSEPCPVSLVQDNIFEAEWEATVREIRDNHDKSLGRKVGMPQSSIVFRTPFSEEEGYLTLENGCGIYQKRIVCLPSIYVMGDADISEKLFTQFLKHPELANRINISSQKNYWQGTSSLRDWGAKWAGILGARGGVGIDFIPSLFWNTKRQLPLELHRAQPEAKFVIVVGNPIGSLIRRWMQEPERFSINDGFHFALNRFRRCLCEYAYGPFCSQPPSCTAWPFSEHTNFQAAVGQFWWLCMPQAERVGLAFSPSFAWYWLLNWADVYSKQQLFIITEEEVLGIVRGFERSYASLFQFLEVSDAVQVQPLPAIELPEVGYDSVVSTFASTLSSSTRDIVKLLGHSLEKGESQCDHRVCAPNSDCVETRFSYHCLCRPGFKGDDMLGPGLAHCHPASVDL